MKDTLIILGLGVFFTAMFIVFLGLFIHEMNKDRNIMSDDDKRNNDNNKVTFGLAFGSFAIIAIICFVVYFIPMKVKERLYRTPLLKKAIELTPNSNEITPGTKEILSSFQLSGEDKEKILKKTKNLAESNPFRENLSR